MGRRKKGTVKNSQAERLAALMQSPIHAKQEKADESAASSTPSPESRALNNGVLGLRFLSMNNISSEPTTAS